MNIGIWSSYFIDLTPEQMVETFSRKGWFMSELSDEHASVLLGRGNPKIVGREFRNYCSDLGMSFPQGHLWLRCDIAALNRSVEIRNLKTWLDLFLEIGIQAAVLHPGGYEMQKAGYTHEEIMEARVTSLQELTAYLEGSPMVICLENIVHSAPECSDLLQIIEAVGSSKLGICLDTGHLNICSGDQTGFIKKAGPYLKALHIADNEGATDQHLMPFGRGTIHWEEVVSSLYDIHYSGLFNLEIPGENRCPLPVRMAKLDYIRRMLDFLLIGNQAGNSVSI